MGLRLHNPRPESNDMTYLAVPILEDAKNAVTSLCKSSVPTAAACLAFHIVAAPVEFFAAVVISTTMVLLPSFYEQATMRSLNNGRVVIKTARKPQIQ